MEVPERYLLKQQDAKLKSLKGFTLLEMVISIAIMVLVVTAASVIFNQTLVVYRYSTSRMAAVREAELAMEWIVRDIRPEPGTGVVLPISSTTDIPPSDADEITLGSIHYHLHADPLPSTLNTIQREEVGVREDLLAQNVFSLSFGYFDAQNQDILASGGVPNTARTVEIIIITRNNEQEFRLYNVANRIP